MRPDFPAAHSMDTEWFAVDAEGRVGRFDSGEDGAVPSAAAWGFSPDKTTFDADLLDAFRLATALAAGADVELDAPPVPDLRVLVADSAAPFADAVAAGELTVVRDSGPAVLVAPKPITGDRASELASRPGARGSLSSDVVSEVLEGLEAQDGLVHFQRDHGDDPGRYERGDLPAAPLRVQDLPPPIREDLSKLRLPVDFAASPEVHLADLEAQIPGEIHTWGSLPLRYPEGGLEAWAAEREEQRRSDRRILARVALGVLALTLLLWLLVWGFDL